MSICLPRRSDIRYQVGAAYWLSMPPGAGMVGTGAGGKVA